MPSYYSPSNIIAMKFQDWKDYAALSVDYVRDVIGIFAERIQKLSINAQEVLIEVDQNLPNITEPEIIVLPLTLLAEYDSYLSNQTTSDETYDLF